MIRWQIAVLVLTVGAMKEMTSPTLSVVVSTGLITTNPPTLKSGTMLPDSTAAYCHPFRVDASTKATVIIRMLSTIQPSQPAIFLNIGFYFPCWMRQGRCSFLPCLHYSIFVSCFLVRGYGAGYDDRHRIALQCIASC